MKILIMVSQLPCPHKSIKSYLWPLHTAFIITRVLVTAHSWMNLDEKQHEVIKWYADTLINWIHMFIIAAKFNNSLQKLPCNPKWKDCLPVPSFARVFAVIFCLILVWCCQPYLCQPENINGYGWLILVPRNYSLSPFTWLLVVVCSSSLIPVILSSRDKDGCTPNSVPMVFTGEFLGIIIHRCPLYRIYRADVGIFHRGLRWDRGTSNYPLIIHQIYPPASGYQSPPGWQGLEITN